MPTLGISTPKILLINPTVVLGGWGEILKPGDQHNQVSKIRLTHIRIRSALCLNKYCSNTSGQVRLQMKELGGERSSLVS